MNDKISELLVSDNEAAAGRRRRRRGKTQPDTESTPVVDSDAETGIDDDSFLPAPRTRLAWPTLGLAILLAMALAFGGGVLVQKRHDHGLSSSSGLPSGIPNFGSGNLPNLGGGQSSGSGSSSSSSAPAVIGTIVSVHGSDITVRDLAGKTHVVHTTGSTSVLTASNVSALKPGTTVSVTGSTSNGAVTATSVTAR